MTSWDVWIQSDKARLTQTTGEELGLKTTWNERPRLQGSTGSAGLRDPPPGPPPAPPLPPRESSAKDLPQKRLDYPSVKNAVSGFSTDTLAPSGFPAGLGRTL